MGHNYFILHSDAVLSTGSIGKNISVGSIKNKINDLISGIGPIDVVMAGHTHVPMTTILNNGVTLLCNGSLSGVDEFCLSIGIVTNHPSQQLFEVTEKYPVGDLRNVMVLEADKDKSLDKIVEPFTGKF
jgi:predicted phosphodiesterase